MIARRKCADERQRGAFIHSLHRQRTRTQPHQQSLGNVRWRRIYIDRRTPLLLSYPSNKKAKTTNILDFISYLSDIFLCNRPCLIIIVIRRIVEFCG